MKYGRGWNEVVATQTNIPRPAASTIFGGDMLALRHSGDLGLIEPDYHQLPMLLIDTSDSGFNNVVNDAIPSIITAQRIKDTLVGMDANAVNELLIKPGEDPETTKRTLEGYEERRRAFAERIVIAASNISYDAERKPIQTLQLNLGDYIAKLQRARDFNERGDTNGTLIAFREAAQIMDNILIPAADELDKINLQEQGQSNFAFEEFKKAHTKVQDINNKALEKAIEQGFQDINGFEIKATVVVIIISVLALLGMRDRIKEYEI